MGKRLTDEELQQVIDYVNPNSSKHATYSELLRLRKKDCLEEQSARRAELEVELKFFKRKVQAWEELADFYQNWFDPTWPEGTEEEWKKLTKAVKEMEPEE